MQHPLDCPHCHQHTHLVAPAAWTRGFVALAWVVVAAMVFMAGMIGPFIMLVLPFLAACGMGLISGAHALAGEPATCASCGKIVDEAAATRGAPVRAAPARVAAQM